VYGTGAQRGAAYLMSWVRQRALDPKVGAAGLSAIIGAATKTELRTMLVRRAGRSMTTLAPFLAGAVAGAIVNRRVTRSLGEKVTAELRGRRR
jgi:outer membrane lipoprotein SlyB